jgi:hypothetical protein
LDKDPEFLQKRLNDILELSDNMPDIDTLMNDLFELSGMCAKYIAIKKGKAPEKPE